MSMQFLKALLERAVKTFCQVFAAAVTAGGTGILEVGWKQSLSVAGLATLLSVLTSIGSARLADAGDKRWEPLVGAG